MRSESPLDNRGQHDAARPVEAVAIAKRRLLEASLLAVRKASAQHELVEPVCRVLQNTDPIGDREFCVTLAHLLGWKRMTWPHALDHAEAAPELLYKARHACGNVLVCRAVQPQGLVRNTATCLRCGPVSEGTQRGYVDVVQDRQLSVRVELSNFPGGEGYWAVGLVWPRDDSLPVVSEPQRSRTGRFRFPLRREELGIGRQFFSAVVCSSEGFGAGRGLVSERVVGQTRGGV